MRERSWRTMRNYRRGFCCCYWILPGNFSIAIMEKVSLEDWKLWLGFERRVVYTQWKKGREALSQEKCHQRDTWKENGKRIGARGGKY